MANGARFGAKEEYLAYLNDLLDNQRDEYRRFISDITNKNISLKAGFEGHVDLGLELAKLQQVSFFFKLPKLSWNLKMVTRSLMMCWVKMKSWGAMKILKNWG